MSLMGFRIQKSLVKSTDDYGASYYAAGRGKNSNKES